MMGTPAWHWCPYKEKGHQSSLSSERVRREKATICLPARERGPLSRSSGLRCYVTAGADRAGELQLNKALDRNSESLVCCVNEILAVQNAACCSQ